MTHAPRNTPHYTIADYEQWQGDWELWNGYAVAMSPAPSVQHQRAAKSVLLKLEQILADNLKCHCEILYEIDWRINNDTVVRPDLMVVCEPIETTWVEVTPTLIVEVLSPSTEKNDRVFKRSLYAEQGVAYYLLVDPIAKQVEVLHLADGAYTPVEHQDLKLHEGCSISLDLSSLWA